jgi:hypothetical protein
MILSQNGWNGIMAKNKHPYYPRNFKQTQENALAKAVKHTDSIPTLPDDLNKSSTLDDSDIIDDPKALISQPKTQKNLKNRVILHFKENWLNWVVGIVITIAAYFFINVQRDITGIQKDITFQTKNLDASSTKIDILTNDISTIKSNVNSLNDRFEMLIDIFVPKSTPNVQK